MKAKIQSYITTWESRCYSEGIPDEAPQVLERLNKVPSYRLICMAIMKNDIHLQTLGHSRIKCRAYMDIKKDELTRKGRIKKSNQLSIW